MLERVAAVSSLQPDMLELVTGMMLGTNGTPPVDLTEGRPPVRQVIEQHVRSALLRPPCLVSFSGGRDSSTILAVATHVARRDGLPDPIPVTLVFPGFPETHEEDWQRLVIEHVGLSEWLRLPFHHELELVGPVARRVHANFGVLFPANAHLHMPMIEAAASGSLLTGIGGDEVLDSVAHPLLRVLSGYRPLRRSDLRAAPRLIAPPIVRRAVRRRRPQQHGITWLTAEGSRQVGRRQAEQNLPERFPLAVRRWASNRYYGSIVDSYHRMALSADVHSVNPFLARSTLAALSHDTDAAGFASREAALERIVGDLLPRDLLTRTSKARFDGPFNGPATVAAALSWDGLGLPEELVRPDLLRSAMVTGQLATRWSLALQRLVLDGHASVTAEPS